MKNKSKILFFSALATFGIAIAAVGFSSRGNVQKLLESRANDGPFEITLNEADAPAELDDSEFADNEIITVKTPKQNDIPLNFVLARQKEGCYVELGHRGMIYNFNSSSGKFAGLTSITATFSGNLFIKTSSQELGVDGSHGAFLEGIKPLTSGDPIEFASPARYFALIAGDSGAAIEELVINYTCAEPAVGFDALVGTYTAEHNGIVYQLDVSRNGAAQNCTLRTLNEETPKVINGTTVISNGNTVSSFNFLGQDFTYTNEIQQNGRKLAFVSVAPSGILPGLDFYRVYDVENFDLYTSAGQGYDQGHGKAVTTGARSHWYADYYAGGEVSSPIGGKSWNLMGGDYDYMQYNATKGHNGTPAVTIKGTSAGLRYIQMNALYGVHAAVGRGSKLSFFAAGGYSDNTFTTKSANNTTMKAYVWYSGDKLTPATQASNRKDAEFTVLNNSDWTEYTMDIDPDKTVYAVGFYSKYTASTKIYIPIDDIRIYTVDPYAEYIPPVAATGVSLDKNEVSVEVGLTTTLTATVAPADATNKNVVWSSANANVASVDQNGVVRGMSEGNTTITVTAEDGGFTASCNVTVTAGTLYLSGTYLANVSVQGMSKPFPVIIASGDQRYIEVNFCGHNMGVSSYVNNGSTFTITPTSAVDIPVSQTESYNVAIAQISGSINNGTFANVTFTGTKVDSTSVTIVNNGSINFTRQDGTNSLYNDCDGTRDQLKSFFGRRYGDPWQVDTNNADRVDASTTYAVDGTGSLKFRGYANNRCSLTYNGDIPSAHRSVYNNVSYWIYNAGDTEKTGISTYIFKSASFGGAQQLHTFSVPAHTWKFVSVGFGTYTNTIYNFQVYVYNAAQTQLFFDNFCIYAS